jgi:hypothetical protein
MQLGKYVTKMRPPIFLFKTQTKSFALIDLRGSF